MWIWERLTGEELHVNVDWLGKIGYECKGVWTKCGRVRTKCERVRTTCERVRTTC